MASVSQLNPYQCDQCGTANIVAAPVLYQQGTHTYSTRFHSGTTQSFSAQAVAPPHPHGVISGLFFFGDRQSLYFLLWTFVGFSSIINTRDNALGGAGRPYFWFPRCSIACRHGVQPSQNCSLQSRSLSSPALELGAHLYMQALWTVPLDSFLAQRPSWFIWPNRQNG